MKITDTKIRQGGLMRCCLLTLDELATDTAFDDPQPEFAEGTVLPCKYCSSSMILEDGSWRWYHEASSTH